MQTMYKHQIVFALIARQPPHIPYKKQVVSWSGRVVGVSNGQHVLYFLSRDTSDPASELLEVTWECSHVECDHMGCTEGGIYSPTVIINSKSYYIISHTSFTDNSLRLQLQEA